MNRFGATIVREIRDCSRLETTPGTRGAFNQQRADSGKSITEGAIVADDKSGPAEGISGVVEGVKGKAKEAVGCGDWPRRSAA